MLDADHLHYEIRILKEERLRERIIADNDAERYGARTMVILDENALFSGERVAAS